MVPGISERAFMFNARYSTFVNWELWWPNFPILVYFKETQTKPEGQVHFFPVIFVSTSNGAYCNFLSLLILAEGIGILNGWQLLL